MIYFRPRAIDILNIYNLGGNVVVEALDFRFEPLPTIPINSDHTFIWFMRSMLTELLIARTVKTQLFLSHNSTVLVDRFNCSVLTWLQTKLFCKVNPFNDTDKEYDDDIAQTGSEDESDDVIITAIHEVEYSQKHVASAVAYWEETLRR